MALYDIEMGDNVAQLPIGNPDAKLDSSDYDEDELAGALFD